MTVVMVTACETTQHSEEEDSHLREKKASTRDGNLHALCGRRERSSVAVVRQTHVPLCPVERSNMDVPPRHGVDEGKHGPNTCRDYVLFLAISCRIFRLTVIDKTCFVVIHEA